MARGTYDNSYNRNRTRIDTRSQSDPAVAVGMRNIHRDTDGSVPSATTAEGQRLNSTGQSLMGSRFRPSRLDAGVKTPRLDAMGSDPSAGMNRADRAAHFANVSKQATLDGKFGAGAQKKAQNLDGRRSLFRDMQMVGAGGVTSEMKQRATSLGIDDKQMSNGMSKLTKAPAAIARPDAPMMGAVPKSLALRPGMPAAAPLQGREKAMADMAKYGVGGAAERAVAVQMKDQARRAEADKTKLAGRQSLFRDMKKAGALHLTPEMRQRANELGVNDAGWDKALGKIGARKTKTHPVAAMEPPAVKGGNATVMGAPAQPTAAKSAPAPAAVPESSPAASPVASAPAPPKGIVASMLADAKAYKDFTVGNARTTGDVATGVLDAGMSASSKAQDAILSGGKSFAKSSMERGLKVIPGNTGRAVREMNIPGKVTDKYFGAAQTAKDSVMGTLEKGSRFRNQVWNKISGR